MARKKNKKKSDEKYLEHPQHKKTMVIFGVSSFIGSNLAEYFKKDYKVIGTYHKNSVRINGILTIPCDVLTKDEVQLILFAFKPDFTIYCSGVSSIVDCHVNEERADALNTSGLFNVAEYCQRYKSQIIFLSSSFIFAGEKRNYFEMDIPDSLTNYGKAQSAAEFYIQKTSLNYLIFRCCRLYGRGIIPVRPTWFQLLQRKISTNTAFTVDDFIQTGYLDVYYLGLLIKMTIEKNVTNRLFQVSSKDIGSVYDFSQFYADIFGLSKDRFSKGRWAFPVNQSQTAGNVGERLYFKMDTGNIEGFLNIELPSIEESIKLTYKRLGGVQKGSGQKTSLGDGVTYI